MPGAPGWKPGNKPKTSETSPGIFPSPQRRHPQVRFQELDPPEQNDPRDRVDKRLEPQLDRDVEEADSHELEPSLEPLVLPRKVHPVRGLLARHAGSRLQALPEQPTGLERQPKSLI